MLSFVFEEVIKGAINKNCLKNAIFWLKLSKWLKVKISSSCLAHYLILAATKKTSPEKHQLMQTLLSFGASVNGTSFSCPYFTPLEAAIRSLDLEAVKMLVVAGANVLTVLPNEVGYEFVDWSRGGVVCNEPTRVAIIEYLLSTCDFSKVDKSLFFESQTLAEALYKAIDNGDTQIAELVVKAGFKIDTLILCYGHSGLEKAFNRNHRRVARWYYDHGAKDCGGFWNQLTIWLDVEKTEGGQ